MFRILAIFTILLFSFESYAQDSKNGEEKKDKVWKINIEAGATLSKGNTREESIYSKNKVDYSKDEWKNLFKTRLENTKVNNVRVRERYDVNNQTRYNYSKRNYRVLELEYIDDRFAGFDYRISETYGYGRNFIKQDKMNFSAQLSGGLRQIKNTDGDKQSTWLVRTAFHFDWEIAEGIVFDENLDISVDEEAVITRSDASLKIALNNLTKNLYLKIGYFLENRSDVPEPGVKSTDTVFMTTIGYSF